EFRRVLFRSSVPAGARSSVRATCSAVAPVAPPGRRGPVEPIPEAWASVLVASPPAARAAAPFRTAAPVRRRGLEYSSIAKLIRARPAPITAIARPGGTYHHQAPASSACEFCAK